MSQLQSLRLAQFWRSTLEPALAGTQGADAFGTAALYEAVGWLNQGVFIRYFDRVDADLIWIQMRDRVASIKPLEGMAAEGQLAQVRSLLQLNRPFREIELATTGSSQTRFELGLFPLALLHGDRFAADSLAATTTKWIWLDDDQSFELLDDRLSRVQSEQLAKYLGEQVYGASNQSSSDGAIVAGCVRLLEHMNTSNDFFSMAERRARHVSIDFESYCDRIGGLNAWRVPIMSSERGRRFEALTNQVRRVLSREIDADAGAAERLDDARDVDDEFERYVRTLRNRWEEHHLQGFFAH